MHDGQDDDLADWLRLVHTPGVGRAGMRRLLARFGGPAQVLAATTAQRQSCVDLVAAAALGQPTDDHAALLDATLAWLAGSPQRRVMRLDDADYPEALLNTADPPLLLYLDGRAGLLNQPSVAVVGSRRPSAQGRDNAQLFGRGLCQGGFTVVSGLAAGVDGAAHEGALAVAGTGPSDASTIAVVGTGLDTVYPRAHKALAARVAAQGLIVSEFPIGAPPLAAHFPQRNRLIAGLSRGTLVVEAALQSGSLITARLAVEAGRDVFAIPGSIHAPQARGCHALIRQGAALVETVDDVLAELGQLPRPVPAGAHADASPARTPAPAARAPMATRPSRTPQRPLAPADSTAAAEAPAPDDAVLLALGHDPASLDTLIGRCGWPAPALSAHLLTLELDGWVARLPGGLYQRRHRG